MKGTSIFVITYAYDVLLLAVAVAGIARLRYLSTAFKILTCWCALSLVLVILEDIFIVKYRNNAPIFHVEALLGYVFYALTYYYLFTGKLVKKAIIISLIVIVPFALLNALIWQPFQHVFPTYVNLPTLGLLAVLSLLLFRQMLLSPSNVLLLRQGVFWYNTAMLFYSTTMFLTTGLSNVYTGDKPLIYLIFYVWYFIVYIFAALLGIALLTAKKT